MGDSTDAALINASGQLLNTSLNYASQGNLNRKTRKYNEQMYAKQRADALADWTMQNEYNSPQSQMARLREAGLNPNLVYGKGADNTSMAVRSSSQPSWSPSAPKFDLNPGAALMTYYDVQMKQAQIDNLKVQNTVMEQDQLLKQATTSQTLANTAQTQQQVDQANSLFPISLEAKIAELRKTKVGTDIMLAENERAAAQNSSNLREAAQRILNMRSQNANTDLERSRIQKSIDNMERDGQLKQLDIDLKKNGIQPTDNIFLRLLGRLLSRYGLGVDDLPPSSLENYNK